MKLGLGLKWWGALKDWREMMYISLPINCLARVCSPTPIHTMWCVSDISKTFYSCVCLVLCVLLTASHTATPPTIIPLACMISAHLQCLTTSLCADRTVKSVFPARCKHWIWLIFLRFGFGLDDKTEDFGWELYRNVFFIWLNLLCYNLSSVSLSPLLYFFSLKVTNAKPVEQL